MKPTTRPATTKPTLPKSINPSQRNRMKNLAASIAIFLITPYIDVIYVYSFFAIVTGPAGN
jgi:hypothetical protein